MKKGLHPERKKCVITCACGASFETLSTKESYFVETCSQCSPAYTGKLGKVVKSGSVDKFRKKYNLD